MRPIFMGNAMLLDEASQSFGVCRLTVFDDRATLGFKKQVFCTSNRSHCIRSSSSVVV